LTSREIIIIEHKYGYKTVYAHLSGISVKKGEIVKRNQKIGYVGSTGRSTNNHLHYEILLNNRPVNPVDYIYAYNKNY
jgi:murein DD-endopeptidase MepM/ murein hydrolase activator NlpD